MSKPILQKSSFGLIRTSKGLEDVLEFTRILHDRDKKVEVHVVGLVDNRYLDYYQRLQKLAIGLPIKWHVGLSEGEFCQVMQKMDFGYLPFPDGASDRRTSLLTLLSYGIPVITTSGTFTTDSLRNAVMIAEDPKAAAEIFCSAEPFETGEVLRNSDQIMRWYSWGNITKRHGALYEAIRSRGCA